MNRRFGIFALGAVVLLGAPRAADAQMKGYVGLGAGVSMPLGDFKDAVKLGWLGQLTAGFTTKTVIGARADVTYGQHKSKATGGGNAKILGFMGDVVVSPKMAGKVGPYIVAGAGMQNLKAEGSSETKFAWNAGAGLNARAGSIGVYLEARFVSVRHDGGSSNFVPITVGVKIGGN